MSKRPNEGTAQFTPKVLKRRNTLSDLQSLANISLDSNLNLRRNHRENVVPIDNSIAEHQDGSQTSLQTSTDISISLDNTTLSTNTQRETYNMANVLDNTTNIYDLARKTAETLEDRRLHPVARKKLSDVYDHIADIITAFPEADDNMPINLKDKYRQQLQIALAYAIHGYNHGKFIEQSLYLNGCGVATPPAPVGTYPIRGPRSSKPKRKPRHKQQK